MGLIQSGSAATDNSSDRVTVTLPNNPVAGNILMLGVSYYSANAGRSVTVPSGWTLVDISGLNDGNATLATYQKVSAGSSDKSILVIIATGVGNDYMSAAVIEAASSASAVADHGMISNATGYPPVQAYTPTTTNGTAYAFVASNAYNTPIGITNGVLLQSAGSTYHGITVARHANLTVNNISQSLTYTFSNTNGQPFSMAYMVVPEVTKVRAPLPLTASGTTTHVKGKFGNALDATNGYYGYLGAAFGNIAIGTMEAWVKTTATGIQVAVGNNVTQRWLGQDGSARPAFQYAPSLLITGVASSINDGKFHHIAGVVTSTAALLYVDGVMVATTATTSSLDLSSGTTSVGAHGTAGFNWSGQIDEARISNIARYTNAIFTVPTMPFAGDTNTLGLYHLQSDGTDASIASPAGLTGLLFWYKADSLTTSADGANVSSWSDSSPGGATATNAYSVIPVFRAARVVANYKSALDFKSGSTAGALQSITPMGQTTQTLTAVISPGALVGAAIITGDNNLLAMYISSSGNIQVVKTGSVVVMSTATVLAVGLTYVVTIDWTNSGAVNVYINGAKDLNSTTTTQTLGFGTYMTLGASGVTAPEPFTGQIFETVHYPYVLNASQRSFLHSYFADKYGIVTADYWGQSRVYDNFNRTNSTGLGTAMSGQAWSVQAGWNVSATQGAWSGSTDGAALINSGLNDGYIVSFQAISVTGQYPLAIIPRATSATGYIKIAREATNNYWWLDPNNDNTRLQVADTTALANGDIVSVAVSGTTFTLYVNGQQRAQWTNITTQPTGTLQGILGSGNRALTIDGFMITKLNAGLAKSYVGSAFTPKPVKVWNGSAWLAKPVKRWDGFMWAPSGIASSPVPSPSDAGVFTYRMRPTNLALTSGASVASLPMLTGSFTFTSPSGSQPILVTNGINGQPALRFDGSTQYMTIGSGIPTITQPVTVAMVLRPTDTGTSTLRQPFRFNYLEAFLTAGSWSMYAGSSVTGSVASQSLVIATFVYNTTSQLYINGVLTGSGNAGSGGFGDYMNLGYSVANSGRNFAGDIYEVLVYPSALTAAQVGSLNTYADYMYGQRGAPAPTDISGLVHRFRASQLTGFTNGASVASAAFELGGITLVQSTAANQPTYITASINGQAGLRFNGTSSYIIGNVASALSQPSTLTVVVRISGTTGVQQIIDGNVQFLFNYSSGQYTFTAGSILNGGVVSTGVHVLTAVMASGSATIYLDGAVIATGTGGTNTIARYALGSQGTTQYLNGDICEIITYNKALSASELVTLDTYLQLTYAVAMADGPK